MECTKDFVRLIHEYLDGDLTKNDEVLLRDHLKDCEDCQKHFHELSRTITIIQSVEQLKAPEDFSNKVMDKLPSEKRYIRYTKKLKRHPVLLAVSVFFLLMFGTLLAIWNQDNELIVSKQEELEIIGDTVIVPKGVTIEGNLFVKNGNLKIEGTVEGDVTLVNGKLIHPVDSDDMEDHGLMASTGEINGDFYHLNQMFDWIWYHLKSAFESIFAFGNR